MDRGDASRPSSSPSERIRYNDRSLILGRSGSGKSTLARALFLSAAAPRLVIDPADSELTAIPGAVTFHDARRIPWADGATLRFVPRHSDDRAGYEALYRGILAHGRVYVWLDEPEDAAPATGYPKAGKSAVVRGRKLWIGHQTCATEPVNIAVHLKRNADHVFGFDLPLEDDRKHIARAIGVPLEVIEAAQAALDPFGFWWFDRRARELTICPPVPEARLDDAPVDDAD